MNRIESEIAKGQPINGRIWGADRTSSGCEVSERVCEHSGRTYFPGHWSGKPNRGFASLEQAGSWRRRAQVLPAYHMNRAPLLRYARQTIEASRDLRHLHDNEQQRYEALAIAAE
jgi:hypothetical protein